MPRVGPWELLAPLGRGGVAQVFRAASDDGPAAVKVATPADEAAARRFEREARALLDLRHPNVVRALGWGRTPDGAVYLAMELLAGETLAERLEAGPLAPEEAAHIGRQAAAGLEAAHAAGFLHRDVKPGNVFLCSDRTVKVLDFGLVVHGPRALHAGDPRLTADGVLVGTISYMAPEQASASRREDERTDVWGLGATLHHALSGCPPFADPSRLAELVRIVVGEPDPLPESVPARLAAAIRGALQKDPRGRPATMGALADALDPRAWVDALASPPAVEHLDREVRLVSVLLAEGVRDLDGLAGAIGSHDGVAAPIGGAEVVGLFGGAEWHGDEPDRAVSAALAARAHARRLGVGTGKTAGDAPGTFSGTALDGARAALYTVRDGDVGADPETRRRIHGAFDLDGARVVAARPAARAGTPREIGGVEVPLFGREAELERLVALYEQSAEESAALSVLLVGAPGVGKTRLRHELQRRWEARAHPPLVLVGAGESHRQRTAFGTITAMLRAQAGLAAVAPGPESAAAVRALVDRALLPSERAEATTELLGVLLGLPSPDSPRLRVARADPRVLADGIAMALGDLLEGLSARRPICLVLEDVQWVDAASLSTVDALRGRLHDRPLFVLGLVRSGGPDRPDALPGAERIELRELSARDTEAIVAMIAGRPEPRLVERAGGNPLFAEELALAMRVGTSSEELPLTVHGAVQTRLDQLPAAEKDALKRAAVLGRVFSAEALAAIGTPDATRLLGSLRRRDLVAPRARGPGGDASEWAFRQTIVLEVARDLLTPDQSRALHARAAAWLRSGSGAPPAEVAEHLDAAGDLEGATAFWLRALDEADRGGDTRWALDLCDRLAGRALAEHAPIVMLRRATALFHQGRTADAELDLARLEDAAPALPAALAPDAARLRVLIDTKANRCDEAERRARVAVDLARAHGSPRVIARAEADLAWSLAWSGRPSLAEATAEALAQWAGASTDEAVLAQVLLARVNAAACRGPNGRTVPLFEEAAVRFEALGDALQAARCQITAGSALHALGRFAAAGEWLRKARDAARRLGQRSLEGHALSNLSMVFLRQGDVPAALAAADAALAIADALGYPRLQAYGHIRRALSLLEGRDAEAAVREADQAITRSGPIEEPVARTARAVALVAAARPAEALDECARALASRDAVGDMEELELELLACRRDALAALGRTAEADAALDEAHSVLTGKLAEITDPDLRRAFTESVPAHARILRLSARAVTRA